VEKRRGKGPRPDITEGKPPGETGGGRPEKRFLVGREGSQKQKKPKAGKTPLTRGKTLFEGKTASRKKKKSVPPTLYITTGAGGKSGRDCQPVQRQSENRG